MIAWSPILSVRDFFYRRFSNLQAHAGEKQETDKLYFLVDFKIFLCLTVGFLRLVL